MPKGARRLPERCVELLCDAEAVIHAGDFSGSAFLRELEALCPRLHAVRGNVDDSTLRERLPETIEISLFAGRIAVIHDAGPAKGRLPRLRRRFPDSDAVVFGHSHLPLLEGQGDFQVFNPGSPTERRRAPRASMGLLTFTASRLA